MIQKKSLSSSTPVRGPGSGNSRSLGRILWNVLLPEEVAIGRAGVFDDGMAGISGIDRHPEDIDPTEVIDEIAEHERAPEVS